MKYSPILALALAMGPWPSCALAFLVVLFNARPALSQTFTPVQVQPSVLQVGRIEHDALTESSGLAASRRHADVFWTHNDKGSLPVLFAINRQGRLLAQSRIEGAGFLDWEDIATDNQGHLYLADTGNNEGDRQVVAVHRVAEPDPASAPAAVKVDQSWALIYPDAPFDCESLFVHEDHGYLISKVTNDRKGEIFRFALAQSDAPVTLQFVVQLPVTSPVSGADLSADGVLLGLVCKSGAYVFQVNGDVSRAGAVRPHRTRYRFDGIEGCCFVPEGLLATAESREIFLFEGAAYRRTKP
jgi:hypothetical protein